MPDGAAGRGPSGGLVASSRLRSGGRLWYVSHCWRTSCFFSGGSDLRVRYCSRADRRCSGDRLAHAPICCRTRSCSLGAIFGKRCAIPRHFCLRCGSNWSQSRERGVKTCFSAAGRSFHAGERMTTGCANAPAAAQAASPRLNARLRIIRRSRVSANSEILGPSTRRSGGRRTG